VAYRAVANPEVLLEQDLGHLKEILEGQASPEEIQQRPAATTVQSGVVAFMTSGVGVSVVGASILLLLLLRRRRSGGRKGKSRIILEF
jgi:hypothetical protein